MKKTEEVKKTIPPYLSYRTVRNFIDGLRVGMPARIDRSVMATMSGLTQSQLLTTLRYLNLISPHGLPTEKLTRLANSEGAERQKLMQDILKTSYAFLFKEGFDLRTATPQQLQELFSDAGAGGETVRKCMAFFMAAAKDAEIPLSPHIPKVRGPRVGRPRGRRTLVNSDRQNNFESTLPEQAGAMGWEQLLLSKFPSFDPAWSPEVQAKWFDAFDKLMQKGLEQEKGTEEK